MPLSLPEVMADLKSLGSEKTRNIWLNHGMTTNSFGVQVADLKKILKRTKKDHVLAQQLWDTGNSDAQYLAGLMADEKQATASMCQHWAETASWHMVAEFSVAWITAESGNAWSLGRKWIDDPRELVAAAGWGSLSSHVANMPDSKLDIDGLRALLHRVASTVHGEQNRVRSTMNGFMIAVGSYVEPLSAEAIQLAHGVGKVYVDVGNTSCKVHFAPEQIEKVLARGAFKKRASFRC